MKPESSIMRGANDPRRRDRHRRGRDRDPRVVVDYAMTDDPHPFYLRTMGRHIAAISPRETRHGSAFTTWLALVAIAAFLVAIGIAIGAAGRVS
jgi:hypothetical protein